MGNHQPSCGQFQRLPPVVPDPTPASAAAARREPVLRLEQLVVRYPGTGSNTLDGLDLSLAAGERLALVGPSGCGKSTLLRMIAGLEEITGGQILISCPFAFGEHEAPADYARYTSFAIRHLFEKNGFEVMDQVKTGSFVEAITQLRLVYWDMYILKPLRGIPVVRSVARAIVFGGGNLWAMFCRSVFPYSQVLYLNNVVLAKKK